MLAIKVVGVLPDVKRFTAAQRECSSAWPSSVVFFLSWRPLPAARGHQQNLRLAGHRTLAVFRDFFHSSKLRHFPEGVLDRRGLSRGFTLRGSPSSFHNVVWAFQ